MFSSDIFEATEQHLTSVRGPGWFTEMADLGFDRERIEQHLTERALSSLRATAEYGDADTHNQNRMVEAALKAALSPAPVGETSAFSRPARRATTSNIINTGNYNLDTTTRWWSGIGFEPDLCCATGGTRKECVTPRLPKPAPTLTPKPLTIEPFVAVTSIGCGVIGRRPWGEEYARAIELHQRMLPAHVMSVLATGTVDGMAPGTLGSSFSVTGQDGVNVAGFQANPYVTAPLPVGHDLTPVTGAVHPSYGAKILSAALTCCAPGLAGLIVATPLAFEVFAPEYLTRQAGGSNWVTPSGHYAGGFCGFDGREPGTADTTSLAPGEQWMYAIGLPSVQASPVWSLSEMARQAGQVDSTGWPINAMDQQRNLWAVMVEQTIAVTFSTCCRYAIRVNPGIAAC